MDIKLTYQYQIHSLLIDYILKNCNNKYYTTLTLSKLLVEIGLVDYKLAFSQFNKGRKMYHLQELIKLNSTEFIDKDLVLINHIIKLELQRLKQNLGSILTKLVKNN